MRTIRPAWVLLGASLLFPWSALAADSPSRRLNVLFIICDDQIATRVAKLLDERKPDDKPFFIVAGFHKPHVPHVAPKKFFDLYPADKMPITVVPPDDAAVVIST